MFGSRSLRLVRLLAAVPACWAGFATPAMAEDVWSSLATVSASAPLASGRVCYSDGRDIACDVNAPTLASLTAPVTLGLDDLSDVTASVSLESIYAGYESGGSISGSTVRNTAFGHQALRNTTTGYRNVAFGWQTLLDNTTGHQNVGAGPLALRLNTSGYQNSGFGASSLYGNTTGISNVGVGYNALYSNVNGNFNTVVGSGAGYGVANSTIAGSAVLGYRAGVALTSATGNILLGYQAGDAITSGNYNIVIGYDADPVAATGSNQLNIGNTIYGDLGLKRVGIGVTSPTESLEVSGTVSSTIGQFSTGVAVGAPFIQNAGFALDVSGLISLRNHASSGFLGRITSDNSGLYIVNQSTASNGNLYLATSNTTRITVRADGDINVGFVGKPSATIHVSGSLATTSWTGINLNGRGAAAPLEVSGTVSATRFVGDGSGLTNITAASSDRITSGTTLLIANGNTNYLSFTTAGVDTGYFTPAGVLVANGISIATPRVSLTTMYASGRAGIGVAAPSATLHVSGSFMVTAADSGCTIDTIGTMRVNPTTKRLQLCLDR